MLICSRTCCTTQLSVGADVAVRMLKNAYRKARSKNWNGKRRCDHALRVATIWSEIMPTEVTEMYSAK